MDKAKLFRYAEIKNQIKELEAEAGELQPEVLEMMGDNNEVDTEVGMFIKASRRKWTYPAEIKAMDDELKEKKTEAEQIGTADYVENVYLLFKAVK